MSDKLYYWVDGLKDYSSDNEKDYDQVIEIKRLNFFIGKNNAGKSRFLRNLFSHSKDFHLFQEYNFHQQFDELIQILSNNDFRRPTNRNTDNQWSSDGTSSV